MRDEPGAGPGRGRKQQKPLRFCQALMLARTVPGAPFVCYTAYRSELAVTVNKSPLGHELRHGDLCIHVTFRPGLLSIVPIAWSYRQCGASSSVGITANTRQRSLGRDHSRTSTDTLSRTQAGPGRLQSSSAEMSDLTLKQLTVGDLIIYKEKRRPHANKASVRAGTAPQMLQTADPPIPAPG